ncbi:MAG: dihydrofolate reductase family protein [Patescibacteria group bacterium]|nr:dihydrofolate reductase family protein [Patescibacteria group bacterium]
MRKLILWNVVTLDGCFEGEQPWDLSFHNLVWGPELEKLSMEQLQEADMLVFGENTYKGMAAHWPNAEKDDAKVAPTMNKIAKIVCSPTLEKAEWNNTTIVRDAVKELAKLKQEGDRPMYIFGSADLSQSLMNAGLLDEVRLCVAPIVLGKGRRLFTDKNTKKNLALLEAKPLSNGGVLLRYQVQNQS